ncbi:hypothetical protein MTS1_01342 [Microbacterium sp. TS-1]|nr:hypothetical protein MTS1_01342 [Microbacterium sp. TS-1]
MPDEPRSDPGALVVGMNGQGGEVDVLGAESFGLQHPHHGVADDGERDLFTRQGALELARVSGLDVVAPGRETQPVEFPDSGKIIGTRGAERDGDGRRHSPKLADSAAPR